MAAPEDVPLIAADGFGLHGRLWGDPAQARGGVLIAAAMGVSQRYYADFAQWLADQGYLVLTFDYRGIGASRPASLRHLQANVQTWAEQDAAAALRCLAGHLDLHAGPTRPLVWVGHSLGGQIFGLVPGRERVTGLITVTAGSGYWRRNAWPLRAYVAWMWFVMVPLLLPLLGYFPGRRLRKVGDLPRGVMAQWRRWCLHSEYLLGEGGAARASAYAQVSTPLLGLSFSDDEYLSARSIEDLHAFYAAAPKELRHIQPAEVGLARIGHFGFFRAHNGATLWPLVTRWLASAAPP